MIGFGLLQVRQHEIVAPLVLRSFDDGCTPSLRTIDNPMVKLVGNLGEGLTEHPLSIPVGIEEADYPFGLLEGLNESVQLGSDRNIDMRTRCYSCGARRKRSWRSPV